jgi:hypothetical protein
VIGAYHRLSQIEASFRISKHDLAARPIYHRPASIEAHLTIVFAAVSRLVEDRTGWSIRKWVMPQPQGRGRNKALTGSLIQRCRGVCCGYGHDDASTRWCTCGFIAKPCPCPT